MDLGGRLAIESFKDKFRSFVLYMDDFSATLAIYFLKDEKGIDILESLKKFQHDMNNITSTNNDVKIKTIRT